MKKAFASVAVLLFAGLLTTSLVAVFHGSVVSSNAGVSAPMYPSFLAY